MFRPASRALLRAPAPAVNVARGPSRRFISSSPSGPSKPRSWKNTFVRVGLAAGAVYYYNTSSVFAETPSLSFRNKSQSQSDNEKPLPTLDSVKPKSREEKKAPASTDANAQPESESPLKSAEELEAEADQQAAFNPETGEINWDCPCLGGMAYGPCGEEFRAAFSCFVYSEEEPKGIDCIDKFKGMQDCFRAHPDVYGAELEDDEDASAANSEQPLATEVDAAVPPAEKHENAKEARDQVKSATGEVAESEEIVPKAWHESEAEKKPEQQTEK
ncbi:coiled-coil-helix-coiled-coil-helix domain-containing protein [Aspergillus mulundensis]|uniref:Mitochondrial intermembrane space import and assembly protein 40 n=1 Tax=Aspergillus mulundensis TaxID=1810919 RepID=A0A3D8SBL2_9EURO|nr:Mitochondrial intermembrane space import and assembly protein 40 [Aspergillus mulundensis]RDW83742.1 Mitochondrial intermembrane space import and assembly protein 40 [Aspergillus mulundensis]